MAATGRTTALSPSHKELTPPGPALAAGYTPSMNVILHIAYRAQWLRGQAEGAYRAESLATQGFIHTSRPHQLLRVANALFKGQRDLVLLYIDPHAVSAAIKYEAPPGSQEAFPHLYGPLNTDAVIKVVDFLPDDDGLFTLPADVTPPE